MRESALSKLTSEELAALGISRITLSEQEQLAAIIKQKLTITNRDQFYEVVDDHGNTIWNSTDRYKDIRF